MPNAPGIGDDTANMAALMLAARWVVQQRLCFPYSLLFVWDTGEEGLGNLNGVRGLMEDYADAHSSSGSVGRRYPGLIDGAVARCAGASAQKPAAAILSKLWQPQCH